MIVVAQVSTGSAVDVRNGQRGCFCCERRDGHCQEIVRGEYKNNEDM